jgi:RNA polymerase sigma-70 factor (ECF subfamily)
MALVRAVGHDHRVDDRTRVEQILAGDREAYRSLVERETPAVFAACYRILGRVAEAEDVTQEAFVLAFRSLASFRGEGSFGAWIGRIAVRQSLRRLSQRREESALGDSALALPAPGPDPLGFAIAEERGEAVRRAVASLPEPYREVVALRFFADHTLPEIAAATERPLNTVKTHLHRGLARLRDALAPEVAA